MDGARKLRVALSLVGSLITGDESVVLLVLLGDKLTVESQTGQLKQHYHHHHHNHSTTDWKRGRKRSKRAASRAAIR